MCGIIVFIIRKIDRSWCRYCWCNYKKESNYNSDFRDLVPLCEKKEIPYELVENINEEKVYKFIENIQPEIAFCFGWSQLIKDDIIQKFHREL